MSLLQRDLIKSLHFKNPTVMTNNYEGLNDYMQVEVY